MCKESLIVIVLVAKVYFIASASVEMRTLVALIGSNLVLTYECILIMQPEKSFLTRKRISN